MTDFKKINEAVRLRAGNVPLSQIAGRLGVGKSTVSDWLHKAKSLNLNYERLRKMSEFELSKLWSDKAWLDSGYFLPNWTEIVASITERSDTIQTAFEKYKASCPKEKTPQSRSSFYREAKKQLDNAPSEVKEVHLHNSFAPGQVAMIDYSGDGITVTDEKGHRHKAQIFVGVLGYSGYIYCCATPKQTRGDWLRAIADMLHFLGGVPNEIWLDNSTSLVKKADCTDPILSPEFENFCKQYDTSAFAVSPRKPTHKGLVENAVKQVQRSILSQLAKRQFFSIEELNKALAVKLRLLNARPMTVRNHESRESRFRLREKPILKPLPPIEYCPELRLYERKVQKGNQIRLGNTRYNVPWGLVGSILLVAVDYVAMTIAYHDKKTGKKIDQATLRSTEDGDEPMRRELVPEQYRLLLMSREELVEEVGEKLGQKATALAKVLAKQSNSRAQKHLRALLHAGEKYTTEEFEAICSKALNQSAVSYSGFRQARVAYENAKKKKPAGKGTASMSSQTKLNTRGSAYFNDDSSKTTDDGEKNAE